VVEVFQVQPEKSKTKKPREALVLLLFRFRRFHREHFVPPGIIPSRPSCP
jgi:hypothetical protein